MNARSCQIMLKNSFDTPLGEIFESSNHQLKGVRRL